MIRNNEDRFGPRTSGSDETVVSANSILEFVTPTEFVELPSKGKGYSLEHPLYEQENIEIRYMTAKDEDILTSRSLLKSGVALDRLISNLIVNKNIDAEKVLMGDRNAIIIAARSSAYGHIYKTNIKCPSCGETDKYNFDLSKPNIYSGDDWEDYDITKLENGNFLIVLPRTNFKVEVKLLTGKEETKYLKQMSKKGQDGGLITKHMRLFIVGIEGHQTNNIIDHFLKNAPAAEARYLRDAYNCISPSLNVVEDYECLSCGFEQEMEVPLGADFFWPDR